MPNGQWRTSRRKDTLPPNWEQIRRVALARDAHTCYVCGGHATHVDHVKNSAEGGTDAESNLRAICEWDHLIKSSAEGGRAKAAKQGRRLRPPEPHPGIRRS